MTRQFDVVVEKDSEGYFVATVPALPGCHTQAKSLDELMSRIKEAIELCLEVEGSPGEPLDFIGVQRVTVSARHRSPRLTLGPGLLASILRDIKNDARAVAQVALRAAAHALSLNSSSCRVRFVEGVAGVGTARPEQSRASFAD